MKNKVKLKRYIFISLIISIIFIVLNILINIYEYKIYRNNINNNLESIISLIETKYPLITKNEIMEILNSKNNTTNIFKEYGIDIDNTSIILENDKYYNTFIIFNTLYIFIIIIVLLIIFLIYIKNKDKDIKDITKYIEEINKGNYELKINSISEDELSILKNEIYKTTIKLKEAYINTNNDKLSIKKSLEDISHQLKTPLTSILIMLDNLIDDPNMDINTRQDFITDIKRQVVNINFLVQNLLKLSKFDSNTIHFIKKNNKLSNILKEAIKNVSTLCDLKDIKIIINGDDKSTIYSDFKWEVEALTNILKNSIEHIKDKKEILVDYNTNNVYSIIKIKDYGVGIAHDDLKHIFERFYKGKNSSPDSIGIGLSLAKAIINEDNGIISVESNSNGTTFIIKYYK